MLLQRTLGNRALAAPKPVVASSPQSFETHLLNRSANFTQGTVQRASSKRDTFFRSNPVVHTKAPQGVVQRFRDTIDGVDITKEVIERSPKEKLTEWLSRKLGEGQEIEWDMENDDPRHLVPDDDDRKLIEARLAAIASGEKAEAAKAAKAKAHQEMLDDLGVTQANYDKILETTEDKSLIRKAAKTCQDKGWALSEVLAGLNSFAKEIRGYGIEVLAKGEVASTQLIVDLCTNWDDLNKRDSISVPVLVKLIDGKAIVAKGGAYSVPQLTGTRNIAYTFTTNGLPPRRIDPEFHSHLTEKDGGKKTSFKWHRDKHAIGPQARRELPGKEAAAMLKACGE